MTEFLDLANKLSGVSLASLLALILFGSWRDVWTWSRDRDAFKLDRDKWQALAMQNLGLMKTVVENATQAQSGPASVSR